MSLAFKRKEATQPAPRNQPSTKIGAQRPLGNSNDDMDDSIPF
jgi:hypothetical protein